MNKVCITVLLILLMYSRPGVSQSVEVFGYYKGYDADTGKLLIHGMLLRDLGL